MFNGILVYSIEMKVVRKHRYWPVLCISFEARQPPWETSGWDSKPGHSEEAAGELTVVWITSYRKQIPFYVQMQMPWILHHTPISHEPNTQFRSPTECRVAQHFRKTRHLQLKWYIRTTWGSFHSQQVHLTMGGSTADQHRQHHSNYVTTNFMPWLNSLNNWLTACMNGVQ